jgi:hypothetical protein
MVEEELFSQNFFEEYNLYVEKAGNFPHSLNDVGNMSVNMLCETCGEKRTFLETYKIVNDFMDPDRFGDATFFDLNRNGLRIAKNDYYKMLAYLFRKYQIAFKNINTIFIGFICGSCRSFSRYFLIYCDFKNNYIMKIGQYPPQDIEPPKEISKMFGKENYHFYKDGLILENHGKGIGAFTYYRRIVENSIEKLIEELKDFLSDNNLEEYNEAVDKIKNDKSGSRKIELLIKYMPDTLLINGTNLMEVIYRTLSEGIHSLSDKDCLNKAKSIRICITELTKKIISDKKENRELSESLKNLLKKSTKK